MFYFRQSNPSQAVRDDTTDVLALGAPVGVQHDWSSHPRVLPFDELRPFQEHVRCYIAMSHYDMAVAVQALVTDTQTVVVQTFLHSVSCFLYSHARAVPAAGDA